jgi:hypothetical protein
LTPTITCLENPLSFRSHIFARGYWRSWQIDDSNRKREESSAFARSSRSANIRFLERAIRMRAAQILGAIVVAASMAALLSDRGAEAQSDTNLNVLRGLAPLSTLDQTDAGKAVLTREFAVTVAIQNGNAREPTGLQFPDQQEQALQDATITDANAYQLADGLGSKLGDIYHSLTTKSGDQGQPPTNISPAVADLIAYTNGLTKSDSQSAKYFFGNGTTDGKHAVSAEALAILAAIKGQTDVLGRAYGYPAGSAGADAYGNSRPFQTDLDYVHFTGRDFFGAPSSNVEYLIGPKQNLTNSPSYPSGHTTYGYAESLLLALLLPQRYPQMIARAAEYGNDRIIMAAHYAVDVLSGRTLATYDIAQLLANRQGYVGVSRQGIQIDDFPKALADAQRDMRDKLEAGCGQPIDACARDDHSRFSDPAKNRAFYEATQTYNLPIVFEQNANKTEDVCQLAPEAGYLLTAAFPYLTLDEADAILTETEGPGGGFLDNGSAFGVYSRLDLYRAAERAIADVKPAAAPSEAKCIVQR